MLMTFTQPFGYNPRIVRLWHLNYLISYVFDSGGTQVNVSDQADPRRQPWAYWLYVPLPNLNGTVLPNASAVICSPTVQIQMVQAVLDSATIFSGTNSSISCPGVAYLE